MAYAWAYCMALESACVSPVGERAEWLRALPAALGDVPWRQDGAVVWATLGNGGQKFAGDGA